MFPSYNQLHIHHIHAFSDVVNLLGSSPGTALHLQFKALSPMKQNHETKIARFLQEMCFYLTFASVISQV